MKNELTLRVTGACNQACRNCSQSVWMADYAKYHMTLAELRTLCRQAESLGIKGCMARITGGEPTMWRYLRSGCRILRESSAFGEIRLLTNGKLYDKISSLVTDGLVDVIAISAHEADPEGLAILSSRHPGLIRINRTKHKPLPVRPIKGTLPAKCTCNRLAYFDRRVWACNNAYTHTKRMGGDVTDKSLSCKVTDDWITYFAGDKWLMMPIHRVCLSNKKVWRRI